MVADAVVAGFSRFGEEQCGCIMPHWSWLRWCPPFGSNLDGMAHSEDKKCIYIDLNEKGSIGALSQRIVDHVRTFPLDPGK